MKKNKDLFTEAVSEMKHFLIGAAFVLVLVAIVPAFAYPMDMHGMTMPSGMSGMSMEEMQKMQSSMQSSMPSSMPSPSPSTTTQKMPCSYLGGQEATSAECGEAYMKAMMHSTPTPAPAPTPPPPPPAPVPAKKTAPELLDIEALVQDLEQENAAKEIEELKRKTTEKEAEAAKAAELKNLELEVEVKIISKNINEKKLQRLDKLLARQKGSKSPKYIKALVKELDKSLQEWKGASCADYPTEVFQLKCEILFTDALKSIKATSLKKKPDIQELKKNYYESTEWHQSYWEPRSKGLDR